MAIYQAIYLVTDGLAKRKGEAMESYVQQELFRKEPQVSFAPPSVMWNLWHGCTKISPGCAHCYVYRRDAEYGKDTSEECPAGTTFLTCFTSDFFHPAADDWRPDAWRMIRERSDCRFYMITKRPERIREVLPPDWGDGYENVEISCTCENQRMADKRLPIFLELPIPNKSIIHEPMLERINIRPYLKQYGGRIRSVSCGGESGPEARICDFSWILDTHMQCVEYGVPFHFHQTGARLRRGDKVYDIPREYQHEQAKKAQLDFDGSKIPDWEID